MIGRLQVEDDRNLTLELVGHLLGVIEVAWDDQVDLDVVAVVDRAQRAGAAGGDRLVIGKDVVDLVAAGAARGRQAANRALLALAAGLEDFLGAGLGLRVVPRAPRLP